MSFKIKRIISEKSVSLHNGELATFVASSHLQREICCVLKGRSHYMLNNQVFKAVPGTVFLIGRQMPHAFGYRECDAALEHLWISFSKEKTCASIMKVSEHGNYSLASHTTLDDDESAAFLAHWDKLSCSGEADEKSIAQYMTAPLTKLYETIRRRMREQSRKTQRILDETVIEEIKRYIHMTNSRNCSLQQLERVSGYNRFYLAHRFKMYAGCTVNEYINQVRIAYTGNALQNGVRQKEIAFELGFSSPANFWLWLNKHREAVEAAKE